MTKSYYTIRTGPKLTKLLDAYLVSVNLKELGSSKMYLKLSFIILGSKPFITILRDYILFRID